MIAASGSAITAGITQTGQDVDSVKALAGAPALEPPPGFVVETRLPTREPFASSTG